MKQVPSVENDTVRCLEQLLESAREGALVGIAYGAMFRRRNFTVNACGEAHRDPVYARGVVGALDDHLGEKVKR